MGRLPTWLELRSRAEVDAAKILHGAGHLLAAVLLFEQQVLWLQVAVHHAPAGSRKVSLTPAEEAASRNAPA